MNEERIAKNRLNIILLVDASKSMQGKRIAQVDQAIVDIEDYLIGLETENSNADFYFTIIPFNNKAFFYNGEQSSDIHSFAYNGIKCGGWSNLHFAYNLLGDTLKKQSQGGIMPDFGGIAPIILLLTDGHPTGNEYKKALESIKELPWFKAALRYGIAIELKDDRTTAVLKNFVGNNGDVISCYDSRMLKDIIKIIVLTASKVKSSSSNVGSSPTMNQNQQAQQEIAEALADTESWEW
ncbi:MAG: VWA domain-containing protein [Bacilli bacterium]|nr:VWA domain-containing protein [Bacilli bacterium]